MKHRTKPSETPDVAVPDAAHRRSSGVTDAQESAPVEKQALHGLLVSELEPGRLYRCRLSHRAVLVVQDELTGPMEGDPRKRTTLHRTRGYVYNAVYGVYQYAELVDRQLEAFVVEKVPAER